VSKTDGSHQNLVRNGMDDADIMESPNDEYDPLSFVALDEPNSIAKQEDDCRFDRESRT